MPGSGDPGPCPVPSDACRNAVVTLEVFDSVTGRTSVFLNHSSFVDLDPIPPAALAVPAGQ